MSYRPLTLALSISALVWLCQGQPARSVAPQLRPSSEGTPTPMIPNPAECMIEPRSIDDLRAVIGVATPGDIVPQQPVPTEVRSSGTEPNDQTVAGVMRTIREVIACVNTGDERRALALYSDNGLAQLGPLPDENFDVGPATPPAEEDRTAIAEVSDIEMLPDGRVGAVVVIADAVTSTDAGGNQMIQDRVVYLILVKEGDRWLIDETVERMMRDGEEIPVSKAMGTPTS